MSKKSKLCRVDPGVYAAYLKEKKKGKCKSFPEYMRKVHAAYVTYKQFDGLGKKLDAEMRKVPGWFR